MSDRLLDLQHAMKDWLEAQPYISGVGEVNTVPIPIVTEDVTDLEEAVQMAIDLAGGICVLIRAPGGKIPSADTQAPVYDPAQIHVRIYEDATTNRGAEGTGQPACKVADALIRLLWTFHTTIEGFNPLVATGRGYGVEAVTDLQGKVVAKLPYYDVLFESTVALDEAVPTRAESIAVVLTVTPTSVLAIMGAAGGPFSPTGRTFTLTNTGGVPMTWTATSDVAWLTLSDTEGTIAAGDSVTVDAAVNAEAGSLEPGLHIGTITFRNVTGYQTLTRSVGLTVS